MRNGYILDAGVLQGVTKEREPNTPLTDRLRREKFNRLVTIKEVTDECIDVPWVVLRDLRIWVERTRTPPGPANILDAFSSSPRDVWWRDQLPRADRAVIGHAIAGCFDVMTTDRRMKPRWTPKTGHRWTA